jgi:AmiR/NasT family two-component response regulator
MIPVLLASVAEQDRRALRQMLAQTAWSLIEPPDPLFELRRAAIPIVLCERDHLWQKRLADIKSARRDTCVVLLSDVADEYLFNEIVQRGGFDVLTRPLRRDRVLSMLDFAHQHWKSAWPVKTN